MWILNKCLDLSESPRWFKYLNITFMECKAYMALKAQWSKLEITSFLILSSTSNTRVGLRKKPSPFGGFFQKNNNSSNFDILTLLFRDQKTWLSVKIGIESSHFIQTNDHLNPKGQLSKRDTIYLTFKYLLLCKYYFTKFHPPVCDSLKKWR